MGAWFRKYVLHNLGLKVLALLSAIALWYAVAREPVAEIGFSVPIEFQHVPEALEITSEAVPEAQIRVRGPQRIIREVAASDVHPVIDLAGARTGERSYELNAARIGVPRGVQVVQVVPAQFLVSLDRRATRQVQVHPRVTGTLPPGYRLETVTSEPSMITITGPEGRVNAVEEAITDPVDASGVMDRMTTPVSAYVNDPLVRVVGPAQVRVTVTTGKTNGTAGTH